MGSAGVFSRCMNMNIIKRVVDDSYVIDKNGLPFHVPNSVEFMEEYQAIDAYAKEHPWEVTLEYPEEPVEETTVSET